MDKPVDKQTLFRSGDTMIDLNKVVAFVKAPQAVDAPAEDAYLMVYLADGSSRTVHGEGDAEAFAQAMDTHLGVNLA